MNIESLTASRLSQLTVIVFALLLAPGISLADEGHPIAIRRCSEKGIAIETMWGLSVAFGVDSGSEQAKEYDLLVDSLELSQPMILRRSANNDEVKTVEKATRGNDLTAQRSVSWGTVFADGVAVMVMHDMPTVDSLKHIKETRELDSGVPSALVALGDKFDAAACEKLIETFAPRLIVVNSDLEQVGDLKVKPIKHDTVAFSSSTGKTTQALSLEAKPYELSVDLRKLFARKEKSQQATMDLFAELSVEQMNFEPPNGTHTPRWNAEHMMGRELLFFSQIYHALDPSIPVMDLNPKQMPKDYEFAHADWTGAEEAKQIQRVEDFTRRFAYLLDGVDMRKKAPGSRIWSIRTLLLQMERHYNQHSSNVRKKMELEQWPDASQ